MLAIGGKATGRMFAARVRKGVCSSEWTGGTVVSGIDEVELEKDLLRFPTFLVRTLVL